jgi:tRNA threonylcarbamoyladenosine biosynthesis protein TsaB
MIVLGFDTATQATAVGLRAADGITLTARDDPGPAAHPGHATRLLSMTAGLLEQSGLDWSEIERIAVGVGPGRFTGLRVGIATARGLAQSLSVELVGISSLRALALPAIRRQHDAAPPDAAADADADAGRPASASAQTGTIAAIDARRGEVFAAAYLGEHEIELPHALRPAQVEAIGAELLGRGAPEGACWRAVGDGALLDADSLRAGGIEVAEPGSPLHLLDGAAVCELGALAAPGAAGQAELARVLPDYRRSPDATLARGEQPRAVGASRA